MSRLTEYAKAWWPDEWVVFGRKLKPFTLGNALLLQRLESPFALEGQVNKVGSGDIALAVIICSMDYDRAIKTIDSWWFKHRLKWFGYALRSIPAVAVEVELFKFHRYLSLAWSIPPIWIEQGKSKRDTGSPILGKLKTTMMGSMGKSESEALLTPLGLAFWDCCVIWESEGGVQVRPDVDDWMIEQNRMSAKAGN
jgi:hypothetical protein